MGKIIDLNNLGEVAEKQSISDYIACSKALEECLRVMMKNGLIIKSCSAGEKSSYDLANFTMTKDSDVFSYLSNTFINNEMVGLAYDANDNSQIIYIGGPVKMKLELMKKMVGDIQTGKKNNGEALIDKIGKIFNTKWQTNGIIYKSLVDRLRIETNPTRKYRIELLCKILNTCDQNRIDKIKDECIEIIRGSEVNKTK